MSVVISANQTSEELEQRIGESLKTLRLSRNIGQRVLAERAGVSVGADADLTQASGNDCPTLPMCQPFLAQGYKGFRWVNQNRQPGSI